MRKIIPLILSNLLSLCAGAGLGLSVKVFMERETPVIHGGGELLLIAAVPASFVIGLLWNRRLRQTDTEEQNRR